LSSWKDLLRWFGAKLFYTDQDNDILGAAVQLAVLHQRVFLRRKTNISDFMASYSIENATIGHIYHSGGAGSDDISLSYMFRTVLVMEAVDTTDAKLSEYPLCSVLLRKIKALPTVKLLHYANIYYEDDIHKFFTVGHQFPRCY
jgi:hypothetical protein